MVYLNKKNYKGDDTMFRSLASLLKLPKGACVAVVGCGGKTSSINCIASELLKDFRILISPTTRIGMPGNFVYTNEEDILNHIPFYGIQYAGVGSDCGKKLRALPLEILSKIAPRYDLLLMEADGSRMKLLKGWEWYEPVIPDFTTHTLCVSNINAIGLKACVESVHRMQLFQKLTGIEEQETVDEYTLCRMICSKSGMMSKASGQIWLLINGVQSLSDKRVFRLSEEVRKVAPLRILAGDSNSNMWFSV